MYKTCLWVLLCVYVFPYLKSHELVVGFGSPGIDFNRVLQSNDQELNPLVFYWKHTDTVLISYIINMFFELNRKPTHAYQLYNARSPPALPLWSNPASSLLLGHCVIFCFSARTSSRLATCSFSLGEEGQKEKENEIKQTEAISSQNISETYVM